MPMFTKKAVTIQARQFTNENTQALLDWINGDSEDRESYELGPGIDYENALIIPTLEGDHRADIGDWIIQGIKGEFYPCKPDIFAATYDPA
mgnify:CR=1 FL=1